MSYNIGPKIGIDGEREFRAQINKINNAYKTLEAETKAVTAAFDANGDEQGKLEKTATQLRKQIDLQQQKVSLLSDAVEKATVKFGSESDEVTRLKGVMYDAQAKMSGLEGELNDVTQRLKEGSSHVEDFGNETDQAAEKVVDFGDILAANFLSDMLMDGLRELAGKLKDIASESIQAAADVQAETAQFEQTFGDLADTATDALKKISSDTNISVTRLQGSYTKLYAFAKTAGADNATALNISSRAMQAAADSAAYYDRSIEDTLESLQAFMKGNYANDAALGIAATETTRNAKANELYAKSFNELSEAQKVDTLLAMVEAGNEASGALGQAAREADAWTNITGELTEAWRQLLAKAGAPVLKQITPIVKDITNSLYDISEDINWEKFGQTVSAIIDFLLSNLPAIINGLQSIGAGLVAMKLAETAGKIVTMVSALVKTASAAKTAGAAITAMSTALNVTPWGLAASAIGVVVGLLTSAVLSAQKVDSELETAMNNLSDRMDQAEKNYASTKSSIEGTSAAAELYAQRLGELEKAGLDSSAAQQEYAACVNQLNQLIPDLNLKIDEQTGLLDRDSKAVLANIAAWKKHATSQALYDKYTEVLEAQGEATADLMTAKAQLNTLVETETSLYQHAAEIEEQYYQTTSNLEAVQRTLATATSLSDEELRNLYLEEQNLISKQTELGDAYTVLGGEIQDNTAKQQALTEEIAQAEQQIESYNPQIQEAEKAIELFSKETESAADAEEGLQLTIQSVQADLDALNQEYTDAAESARESIDKQIGLFDELKLDSDYTAQSIIDNWNAQKKAFQDYELNLQKAVELGLDESLVKQLSDGSAESMQILNAMVNDTDIDIDEINKSFEDLSKSKDSVSKTMGSIQTDYNNRVNDMVAKAKESGINVVDGLIKGINIRTPSYDLAMRKLARAGQKAFDLAMKINSPSKWGEGRGEFIVDGGIIGIQNRIKEFKETMAELANSGQTAFIDQQAAFIADYPNYMVSPVTNSRSISHNYGGININISQQPGESAEELAQRVMEVMQMEIDAEGAVFHG